MKKNYYTIHKNKKKRKSTITKQMEALKITNRVVRNAIILAQKIIELSCGIYRPIPNYIKGGNRIATCGMHFSNEKDNHVESIVLPNGSVKILKPKEQLYINESKVNIDVQDKKWFDEVNKIDPLVLAKMSTKEENFNIYGIGNIQPSTDFSKENFQILVNDGKLTLTNPFIQDDLIEEIKNYKPKRDRPKENKGNWFEI